MIIRYILIASICLLSTCQARQQIPIPLPEDVNRICNTYAKTHKAEIDGGRSGTLVLKLCQLGCCGDDGKPLKSVFDVNSHFDVGGASGKIGFELASIPEIGAGYVDSSGKERFGYSIKGGQLGAEGGVERLSDGSFKSIGGKVNTPAGHFGGKIGCEVEVCVGGCITINFC